VNLLEHVRCKLLERCLAEETDFLTRRQALVFIFKDECLCILIAITT
jgi:hypothetical protein